MSTNFENSEEKRINCEGGFGIMPHRLRKDVNINTNAKFLFMAIFELQHEKGYCYASNKYLAMEELNGVHPNSIPRWLSELEDAGWIKVKIIRGEKNEVVERRIYTNLNNDNSVFMTPHESTFMTPINTIDVNTPINPTVNTPINPTVKYKKNNIEKEEKENIKRKATPVNGSPSSPKVDELRLAEDVFENRFWVLVPNKVGKEQSKQRFFQITNNCKNEKKVNEVIEGYKRYVVYLNKCKNNDFNRRPKDPSTFLNVKNKLWLDAWEFVEEEPAKKETTPQIQQPKDLERRIGIARRLKLLERFLPDEYDREWKFIPKEVKEIIVSEDVEKVIKDIKSNEETLITQIACVTMMGRDGYMTWKDKYEEETGERPTYDLEFYIPFGKKLPNDIWKWLLKYSHNFGLPSERKIDEARQWYYKSDHSAAWNLFA